MANINEVTQIRITAKDETQAAFASVNRAASEMKTSFSAIQASIAGFVGAAGIGFLASWTKDIIGAAAALDDLADATGSSVESLSKLSNIAYVSGTSFSTIDSAIKKLAVGMAGIEDESGKAGKALAALGIQSRDPAQALTEIAQKFAEFEDGSGKAALAVAIFGKRGADLLPVLKDIAQNSSIAATVTGDMAREAEKLEKSWRSLSVQANAFKTTILADVVPTLNEWIDNTRKAHDAGLTWFKSFQVGTTYASELQPRIEQLAKQIADAKANLKTDAGFDGILGWLKTSPAELAALNKEMAVLLGMVAKANQAQNADKYDRYLMGLQGAPAGTFKAAPSIGGTDSAKVKAAVDYYLKGLDDIAAALKAEDAARRKVLEGAREQLELIDKLYEANAKNIEQIDKTTEGYQKQLDALTMTEDAILAKEQARLQEIVNSRLYEGYINAETDALQRQIKVIDELRAAKSNQEIAKQAEDAAREWQKAADSISNSLTDALLRGFESGKDWARNFIDTLKNMFGSLVLRPVIQAIVGPVAGGITGALGFAGNAAASGGSALGGLGNFAGLLGGGASAFGGGFSGALTNIGVEGLIGGTATNFAGITGSLGAGNIMGALGLAAPYLMAAVGIGMAVRSILAGNRGGPKTGGFGTSGLIGALSGADGGRWFTPNGSDASVQSLASATATAFKTTLASLGGSGIGGFAFGFDSDPQGTAPNRLHAGAYVNGQMVYDSPLSDLGRDDAALQAALELESKRALLAALKASDLPQQIAAVFDTLTAASATSAQIDNLLAFGTAMKSVIDAIGGSVLSDAQTAWEQSQRNSIQILADMGAEIVRLAGEVDGSTSSMQALASATTEYRSAVVQTLVAIKEMATQVDEMFGATRDALETFGLSPEALYDRYRKDADAAMALLATANDPESVLALSQRINDDINRAFSALGDEGKTAQQSPLIAYLDQINAYAQAKLATLSASIGASAETPFSAAGSALDSAAAKFQNAADGSVSAASTQLQAANMNLQAAQINLQAAQTPVVVRMTPSEING